MGLKAAEKAELKRFVAETPFTRREVLRLWKRFDELDDNGNGKLTLQELLDIAELRYNPFAARLVDIFDEDGSGEITLQRFINLFSVFSPRCTLQTKIVWAFAIWDFDGDDLVGPRDIKKGLHILTNATLASLQRFEHEAEQEDAPERDLEAGDSQRLEAVRSHRRRRKKVDKLTAEQISQVVAKIEDEIDPSGTGLSFNDFESLATRMPDFLTNLVMSVV